MSIHRILHGALSLAAVSCVSTAIGLAQMQGSPNQAPQGGGTNGVGGQGPTATRPYDQTNQTQPAEDQGSVSQQQMDKQFVHGALQGGMAEVALGQLALEKSSNDDVKKFAQQMVDDHTKLGDDMKPVAEQIGVKIPSGLSKQDQGLKAKLEKLSGTEFDKAYLQAMLKDHKKDYGEFQREAQSASIPQVREAAQKGSPVIKSHLEHVQMLTKSNMNSGMATR